MHCVFVLKKTNEGSWIYIESPSTREFVVCTVMFKSVTTPFSSEPRLMLIFCGAAAVSI